MNDALPSPLSFWQGRKVFITGQTGFKGSWLSQWLLELGAELQGYALPPIANGVPDGEMPLFDTLQLSQNIKHEIGDIRDRSNIRNALQVSKPEIVFHLAAQPLVRDSYYDPAYTYETNVMGTVNLLEACRACDNVRAIIIVTSDKCYENVEQIWGYKETDPMGGFDPYSNSKGCAELVTSAYRKSFYNLHNFDSHGVCLASVRAGNVIGGGDWSQDRLVPDIIRAYLKNEKFTIRNPHAIRPWQHVLESLRGYLLLAERAYTEGHHFSSGWNFGPSNEQVVSVEKVASLFSEYLPNNLGINVEDNTGAPHEANLLRLDSTKASMELGWKSKIQVKDMVKLTAEWYSETQNDSRRRMVSRQITEFGI